SEIPSNESHSSPSLFSVNPGFLLLDVLPFIRALLDSSSHALHSFLHFFLPFSPTAMTASRHPSSRSSHLSGHSHKCSIVSVSSSQILHVSVSYRSGCLFFISLRVGSMPCSFFNRYDRL